MLKDIKNLLNMKLIFGKLGKVLVYLIKLWMVSFWIVFGCVFCFFLFDIDLFIWFICCLF